MFNNDFTVAYINLINQLVPRVRLEVLFLSGWSSRVEMVQEVGSTTSTVESCLSLQQRVERISSHYSPLS